MKRKVYLDNQNELVQRLNLKCAFDIKTSFITIGDEQDEFIVVQILLASGTILKKWQCSKNEDGTYYSVIFYENTIITEIVCDIENCDEIVCDDNINCYLCDKTYIR
jgi:hypothetical protein